MNGEAFEVVDEAETVEAEPEVADTEEVDRSSEEAEASRKAEPVQKTYVQRVLELPVFTANRRASDTLIPREVYSDGEEVERIPLARQGGRYACESTDYSESHRTEEGHARRTLGYFEYLKWQLKNISTKRNTDTNVLEKLRNR